MDLARPFPDGRELRVSLRRALPVLAIAACAITIPPILWASGRLLGYDFRAYEGAAERLLAGRPLYDPAVDVAGGFAIYLYPPPFALLAVPFAVLPEPAGLWTWLALSFGAFLLGAWLLPVDRTIRWLVVLLAALQWPFVYSLKLGQVGPVLFLALAAGWRWLDRPSGLGASIAAGTIVKLQPALLLAWAVSTRRWRATAVALGLLVLASAAATILTGLGTWLEYARLLTRVSAPVTTPHNFAPGAVLFQAGVPEGIATAVQWANVGLAGGLTVWSWFRAPAAASYQATLVASQLVSPLLWDHYAMLLLLPVAYLLAQRAWWALIIPVATSLPLLWLVPAATYPVVFWLALLGCALRPTTRR
ncbi:MAG TPA: glycosyltransferase family 87 protein [Candidatus Limnocylindrales bacterium]|nr:glycosyltransferase family 87 protein [Candidatus Limnocylindrales bacterium]